MLICCTHCDARKDVVLPGVFKQLVAKVLFALDKKVRFCNDCDVLAAICSRFSARESAFLHCNPPAIAPIQTSREEEKKRCCGQEGRQRMMSFRAFVPLKAV